MTSPKTNRTMASKLSSSKRKVIAFLFESSDREVDEYKIGVLQYARPAKDWAFIQVGPSDVLDALRRQDSFFDGAIGELGHPAAWAAARKARFPVVNLFGGHGLRGLPTVGVDDRAIGQMAAEHLMGLGLRHFGFFGVPGRGFCIGRRAGFEVTLRRRGFQVDAFRHFKKYRLHGSLHAAYVPWEKMIAGWLQSLPLPCGIFCCDDMRAEWVSLEARNLGLRIPDDIAIIGVDDNPVHCSSAVPELTSIRLPVRKAGMAAAKVLDELLTQGHPETPARILLPPETVISRGSTDLLALGDPNLVKALRHIRSHSLTGRLRVEDVVAQTGYCRRILEDRFRQVLGRTIFQEIRRHQIEQSQKLLRETNETMDSIADSCGWGNASHFGVEFKKITGLSPGEYRRKMK
jgi:LacI family transcriptional regulator